MNTKANMRREHTNRVWVVLFAFVLTACAILCPELAFAKTYAVNFVSFEQGFDIPEKDMFEHFGELKANEIYSGVFEIENKYKHEVVFEFGVAEESNPSEPAADVLLDTIKLCLVNDETGSVVYEGSLRVVELNEFVELAALQPGEQTAFTYTVKVPETLPFVDHPLSNEVIWVFKVTDKSTQQILEAPVQAEDNFAEQQGKIIKPLPKTADALTDKAFHVLVLVCWSAVVICVAIAKRRYTLLSDNSER